LRDFALALFVGLLTGAYSSIFVATPVLAWWKEREPRYRALRERSAAQLARDDVSVAEPEGDLEPAEEPEPEPAPAAAGVPAAAPAPTPPARPSSPRPVSGGPANTRAPRPRQQRRRKRR
jgi:preprotein translocase subunit SecF